MKEINVPSRGFSLQLLASGVLSWREVVVIFFLMSVGEIRQDVVAMACKYLRSWKCSNILVIFIKLFIVGFEV